MKRFLAIAALLLTTSLSAVPAYALEAFYVEIGNPTTAEEARVQWDGLVAKHKTLLNKLAFYPKTVIQPDGTKASITQAGPIESKARSQRICKTLFARNIPCFVIEGLEKAPPTVAIGMPQAVLGAAAEARSVQVPVMAPPPVAEAPSAPRVLGQISAPPPAAPAPVELTPAPPVKVVEATPPPPPPAPRSAPVVLKPEPEMTPPPPTEFSVAPNVVVEEAPPPPPTPLLPPVVEATPPAPPPPPPPPVIVEAPPSAAPPVVQAPIRPSQPPQANVAVAEAIPVPLSAGEAKAPAPRTAPVIATQDLAPVEFNSGEAGWLTIERFDSERVANSFWNDVRARAPESAAGLRVRILRPLRANSGAAVRLNVGPFPNQDVARNFCNHVVASANAELTCRFELITAPISTDTESLPASIDQGSRYEQRRRQAETDRQRSQRTPEPRVHEQTQKSFWAQVVMADSKAEATRRLEDLRAANSDVVGGIPAQVSSASGRKGKFTVRLGPLSDEAAADELCGTLQGRSLDCMVVSTF